MTAQKDIIIAIDGPAASGKGTLSRKIAEHLGLAHMDTGALYRAVAHEVLEAGGNPENEADALKGVQSLTTKIAEGDPSSSSFVLHSIILRGEDIGEAASKVAALGEARKRLVALQRDFAQNPGDGYKGAVLDGRDIGTVICPDADVKLYVTARPEIRAERRTKELQSKGIETTYEAVLRDIRARDTRDADRKTAPMKPAKDAIVIDTSDLGPEEMLEKALEIIQSRRSS